jgi:two-component system KDP operon response regulator KdpE
MDSPIATAAPAVHTTTSASRRRISPFCALRGRPNLKGALNLRDERAQPTRPRDSESTVAEVAVVILIEDDPRIRAAVARTLEERGHAVRSASAGLLGLQQILDEPPDVVVLDLGLPDVDGREILTMLRAVSTVPVIAATARDDDAEIVATLDAGADDYVIKPFSAEQLDARIRAVLRRSRADAPLVDQLTIGDLTIDAGARDVTLAGESIELSRKEFELLHRLALDAGQVVTKRQLLADVWQLPFGGGDKTVDVHLSWLRRKLGETAAEPRYLHTVRGVGVKLVAPPEV